MSVDFFLGHCQTLELELELSPATFSPVNYLPRKDRERETAHHCHYRHSPLSTQGILPVADWLLASS